MNISGTANTFLRIIAAIAAVTFVAACDNPTSAPSATTTRAVEPLRRLLKINNGQYERWGGVDVVFAQIAKSAPSFSGAYYDRTDRDGRMIIRLSDMSQAMVAEQTLRDILSKTPRRISTVTARIAKYSFLALSDWRDSVFLTAPAGLIYTIDIDEEEIG